MFIELTSFALGFALALGLILPLGQQNMFVLTYGTRSGKFSSTIPVFVTASFCDTLLILLWVFYFYFILVFKIGVKILGKRMLKNDITVSKKEFS